MGKSLDRILYLLWYVELLYYLMWQKTMTYKRKKLWYNLGRCTSSVLLLYKFIWNFIEIFVCVVLCSICHGLHSMNFLLFFFSPSDVKHFIPEGAYVLCQFLLLQLLINLLRILCTNSAWQRRKLGKILQEWRIIYMQVPLINALSIFFFYAPIANCCSDIFNYLVFLYIFKIMLYYHIYS